MTGFDDIPAYIEGKLHAQRQVLAALVAEVIEQRPETATRLLTRVSQDASAANQAEDPGVIPDRAFAIQASIAEELRLIAKQVEEIRAASGA